MAPNIKLIKNRDEQIILSTKFKTEQTYIYYLVKQESIKFKTEQPTYMYLLSSQSKKVIVWTVADQKQVL